MYADPKALEMYSGQGEACRSICCAESLKEFHPKSAMQTEQMADLDGAVKDAVTLKFLDAPLTKEQLAEFLQIPPKSLMSFRGAEAGARNAYTAEQAVSYWPDPSPPCRAHQASRRPPSRFAARNVFLLAEFAHLALARDGRLRHQRRDAEFGQRDGDLLHFLGAADAVARHAFEVVVDDLRPIERRIIVLQRCRDLVARCRRAARRGSIRRSAPRCP